MPLTCAVQLALVELLCDMGIQFSAVTGHSSGEVAAAFAAGALSLRDAMASTYFRGLVNADHLTHTSGTAGGMMAVGLGDADVQAYLDSVQTGKVVVACVNSPSSVTLSGDIAGIQELEAVFKKENVFARALKVQAAFHSHHMLPLEDPYLAALERSMDDDKDRAFNENMTFVSPVTGESVEDARTLGPQHWVRNMTHPVLFSSALSNMVARAGKQHIDVIIEVGPHSALAGPIRQILKGVLSLKPLSVMYASCLERGKDAVQTVQSMAGFLIERGYPLSTSQVNCPNRDRGLRTLTTLPSYPWNHTQRFWHDSLMSVEHNDREHPPHDLLGTRLPGISSPAPVWRHIIRTMELPWVRDHVVQGNIVYPGAGYIVMAIEAMRQIHTTSDVSISGYRLSEVEIAKAVVIPENAHGIEVQLFLEPISEKWLDDGKRQFRIYSISPQGTWVQAARGFIAVETKQSSQSLAILPSTSNIQFDADFPQSIPTKELYETLHAVGVSHGPIFQNLVALHGGASRSKATFRVHDTIALMPHRFQQPHVIHPITLDQVFQAAYATLSPEATKTVGAAIPCAIKELYISSSVDPEEGAELEVFCDLQRYSSQGFHTIAAVLPTQQKTQVNGTASIRPVIELDGMRFQNVSGAAEVEDEGAALADICSFVDYEPSFSLNNPAKLFETLQRPIGADEKKISQDLLRATYHLVADAVAQLSAEDIQALEWHHKRLYTWMQLQLKMAASDELAPRSSKWANMSPGAKAMFLDRVAVAGSNGALLVRIGRRLVEILRGETAPLEIMLEGGLLYKFYKNMLHFNQSTIQLAGVAAAYARDHPRARILEIGGGTGGCTEPVLRALQDQAASFEHYEFTDVSSGFFQAARERFAEWGDSISYSPLNVEEDPVQQGFEEKSCDLIIAALVLHATKDMEVTMRNVRRLLKDGGKLLLVETTKDWSAQHLIFGTLPGWWLSKEPERAMSPNMPLGTWHRLLEATGFSGIDADVWDCNDENFQASSVILSTAVQQNSSLIKDEVALVYDSSVEPRVDWLRNIVKSIASATGVTPILAKLGDKNCSGKLCIFVTGLEGASSSIEAGSFEAIKSLITQSKGILWITSGATVDCVRPENALALGLLRTCRAEDATRRFISLDLDPARSLWDNQSLKLITRVFATTFYSSNNMPGDTEISERGGEFLVPRVRRDKSENITFANTATGPELKPFVQPDGRELKMEVAIPGRLDSIVFREDEEAGKLLPHSWVEIAPHAYGLNFHDVMGAMGQLDEKIELGYECAGVVTRTGSGVKGVKTGDRVVALTLHGHFASRVRVPRTSVVPLTAEMSFDEAASRLLAFATAYYAMFEVARLEPGETVLIHAASGGVGQACIILAQWKKIDVFVTVSTPEKRAFLSETYGIPDDRIFSSRNTSFGPGILAATNSRGVDAIINSLAGPLLQESLEILATQGRFVEIGKRDIHRNMALDMGIFRTAASFTAVDLVQLVDHRGSLMQRILVEVMALFESKAIRNISPVVRYPMAQIGTALRSMQTGTHIGKLVVVPEASDLVNVSLPV
jgi:NADPH:quinone reductase-like Zn-dependent oxidoreductase/malonyl CoA-acyl carrier protein transacylase/ubiquinone/menaquinone biosynthesis C-methylase UbiE